MNIISDCIIYDCSELTRSADNSAQISQNTSNTWQPDRDLAGIQADTSTGKIAEAFVEKYIRDNVPAVTYQPYDSFRTDNFEKHAPFDGLLYSDAIDSELLSRAISSINHEAAGDPYGRITDALRARLRQRGIYTVEVKSTRVNEKKIDKARFTTYSDNTQVERLIAEICSDDFLTYPKYQRYGDLTWAAYCEKYKAKLPSYEGLSASEIQAGLKKTELASMDDFYIRVYVDESRRKVMILGYITREDMVTPPYIKKMIQCGKSEKALYFAHSLTARKMLGGIINEI